MAAAGDSRVATIAPLRQKSQQCRQAPEPGRTDPWEVGTRYPEWPDALKADALPSIEPALPGECVPSRRTSQNDEGGVARAGSCRVRVRGQRHRAFGEMQGGRRWAAAAPPTTMPAARATGCPPRQLSPPRPD